MEFKTAILKILNIEEPEVKHVLWSVIYSFFLGGAIAYFFTGSTALFLNIFEREMIPLSFIVAGIIVIIVGQIYSFLQNKYRFSISMIGGLGFLLISVIIFSFLFSTFKSIIIIFTLYAWNRVFAYIHNVVFWGMAGKLFSLQQAKRVFGLISGGEVIGLIVAFFSVPILLKFINTEDLLFISTMFLLAGFIVLLFIIRNFKSSFSQVKAKTENKSQKLSENVKKTGFLSNRYYKLFFLIAFLPIFAQFFVDFVFQAQAKIEFPKKETLTAFIGLFFGLSAIVEFVLKAFLSGRLMSKYGVKFGLIAFPVVLGFSFLLASVVGIFYGAVSIFFSFVTLGRLFTRAVRTSFNDPATQILYQPLPKEERISFQNKVESGPKAYASFFAGILLWIFAKIPSFTLVHFAIFLLIIIIVWYKVSGSIYVEYKKKIQEVLSNKSFDIVKSKSELIVELLKEKILSSQNQVRSYLINLYKDLFPFNYNQEIDSNLQVTRKKYKLSEIVELSISEKTDNRKKAAVLLADYEIYKIERPMIRLLNDSDYSVRCQALITAGLMKENELFQHLFENFKTEQYRDVAFKSMLYIGNIIFSDLSKFFYKLENEPELQIKIIEIFEKRGGENAIVFLRKKINYPNKQLRDRIIKALANLNYKATKYEKPHIIQKIVEEVRNFVYLAASLVDLRKLPRKDEIIIALKSEMSDKKEKIFILLSIIYDSVAIQLIYDNFQSKEIESEAFALEIADTVISDVHKELLLPVFESKSNHEIVKKYKYSFSQEKMSIADRLIDVINSDLATNGYFTKAIALNMLSKYKSKNTNTTLKACLVHPNKMISEIAAMVLFEVDKEMFTDQIDTLSVKYRSLNQLSAKVQLKNEKNNLLTIEKLDLIKEIDVFNNLKDSELHIIAENSNENVLQEGDEFIISEKNKNEIFIVIFGVLNDKNTNNEIDSGNILSTYNMAENDTETIFEAKETTLIFKTKLFYFHNLFYNNSDFAKKHLETV